jgi:hypothetical protein
MTTQNELSQFVEREVYVCQSSLVDELLRRNVFSFDEIENLYIGSGIQEIYEWWVVSSWLAKKLQGQGEPILENDYGVWWGRTTTGQAILLDEVIERIYDELS